MSSVVWEMFYRPMISYPHNVNSLIDEVGLAIFISFYDCNSDVVLLIVVIFVLIFGL